MPEKRASLPPWPHGIDVPRYAICSRMLVVEPIWVTATRGFRYGYFPHRTRQRIDSNAAKPSCPNCPGFGFEQGYGHKGHRRAGAATGPAFGHEWQPGQDYATRSPLTGQTRNLSFAQTLWKSGDAILGHRVK